MSNNIVTEFILKYWYIGSKVKRTPSGWITRNAPCCHHRGETQDNRQRGGLMISPDGSVTYNCFNCKYKCVWKPGNTLSAKFKRFLYWLNAPFDDIKKLDFDVWLLKEGSKPKLITNATAWTPNFKTISLPEGSKPLSWWAENNPNDKNFLDCMNYLIQRDPELLDRYSYLLTNDRKGPAYRSIIIPFYYNDQIVGWTARKIDKTKQRYMSEVQVNYLFNVNSLNKQRNFIILVEGVFDAINLDCVGVLGSTLSNEQIDWLNSFKLPIIVVPDRDKAGKSLMDVAISQGWSVSLPDNTGTNKLWGDEIKDVSDAVAKYGIIYTMYSILEAATDDKIEIEIKKSFI